jgi:hypothetical protein
VAANGVALAKPRTGGGHRVDEWQINHATNHVLVIISIRLCGKTSQPPSVIAIDYISTSKSSLLHIFQLNLPQQQLEAMADWVNTVVGLWDVANRVAAFANDLRSAQDDFIGLRAEAECLLICINSLNSPSCLDSLYRYINAQQAADLKSIVKTADLNMKELNQFLAKCRRVVELHVGRNAKLTGLKGVSRRVKEAVAKAWARYRFTMKNKQPFRDKLILPAQSINIYLTMLTHVGLVNVGFLIQLSGHGGVGARGRVNEELEGGVQGAVQGGVEGGAGGTGGVGDDQGGYGRWQREDGGGGGVIVSVGPVDRWNVVGRRVAFRDSIVDESELTTDIEDQIVRYALHLTRGGTPFHNQSGNGSSGWGNRITKGTKRRTHSRSRSVGLVGLERDKKGQIYLVRKRSVRSSSSERIETVGSEYRSGWESESHTSR